MHAEVYQVIPFDVNLALVCCRPLHGTPQCLAIEGISATDRTQRTRQADDPAPRHGTHPFLDATGFKADGTRRRCMGTRDQNELDVLLPAILPAPSTTTPTVI